MLANQPVLIPPPGSGTPTPNEGNQLSRGWSVRKTIAQNIHFVKLPPIANVVTPSRRRLIPASTSDRNAADGASKSSSEITSFRSWGVCITSTSRFVQLTNQSQGC